MSFRDTVWKYFVLTEANKSCAHPIIKLEEKAVLRLISEMDRATLESLGRLNRVLKLKSDLFSRQRKQDLHSKVWFIFKDKEIVLISVSGAKWVIETLSGKYFVLTLTDGKEKRVHPKNLFLSSSSFHFTQHQLNLYGPFREAAKYYFADFFR